MNRYKKFIDIYNIKNISITFKINFNLDLIYLNFTEIKSYFININQNIKLI